MKTNATPNQQRTTRWIVQIFSTSNFIAAMAAMETIHPGPGALVDFCIVWPDADSRTAKELSDTLHMLAMDFSTVGTITALTLQDFEAILGMESKEAACAAFRARFPEQYDYILYAHDVVGESMGLMAATWPDAKRICFGDAFGNVYQREVHLGHLGIKAHYSPWFGCLAPHLACLALPVDQSGKFLEKTPLQVVPKECLASIINRCAASHDALHLAIAALTHDRENRRFVLLLTENNAEGNFQSFEQDIAMYASILRDHATPDCAVVVKAHPGEKLPRGRALQDAMPGWDIRIFDPRFARIPVEIMPELIRTCDIVCLSYPSLSIPYLYGKRVINPLSPAFIERWFAPWTWRSFLNSMDLYNKPLAALDLWDGTGVLWAGSD